MHSLDNTLDAGSTSRHSFVVRVVMMVMVVGVLQAAVTVASVKSPTDNAVEILNFKNQQQQEMQEVPLASLITLQCQVDSVFETADITKKIYWEVQADEYIRICLNESNVYSDYSMTWDPHHLITNLTIHTFRYTNTGMYLCGIEQPTNKTTGNIFDTVSLEAVGSPDMRSIYTERYVTLYTKNVVVCEFRTSATSSVNVTWSDTRGNVIASTSNRTIVTTNKGINWTSALKFENVLEDDLQNYTCEIHNQYGQNSTIFIVKGDPYVIITRLSHASSADSEDTEPVHHVEVGLGQSLGLKCMGGNFASKQEVTLTLTKSNGTKVAFNRHDDMFLHNYWHTFVGPKGQVNFGVVSNIYWDDICYDMHGNFSCAVGSVSSFVQVSVTGKPEVKTTPKVLKEVLGARATINCTVTANPPVDPDDLVWLVDSHPLGTSSRYRIVTKRAGLVTRSELHVLKVRPSTDSTSFVCRAENQRGYSTAVTSLIVDGCPPGQIKWKNEYCVDKRKDDTLVITLSVGIPVAFLIVIICCSLFRLYRRRLMSKHRHSVERILKENEIRRNVTITFTNSASSMVNFQKVRLKSEGDELLEKEKVLVGGKEFPRDRLRLLEPLGEGSFGQVLRSQALNIIGTGRWETVAVKMCKEKATDMEKADFIRELTLLSNIPSHLNVITYYGCCVSVDPPMMVMEYAANGDLLTYLRGRRPLKSEPETGELRTGSEVKVAATSPDLLPSLSAKELFAFSLQIAKGMKHLADNHIVHRDVAARNVLVTDREVCKITDFGLARDVRGSDTYERKSKGPLPIRWMSPEALVDGRHTFASDVWAYGVLVWEIVTLGASPYPGVSARQVFKMVTEGRIMDRPKHCTNILYELMVQCWRFDDGKRPTFQDLCWQLEKLLEQEADYIDLTLFEEQQYAVIEPALLDERL